VWRFRVSCLVSPKIWRSLDCIGSERERERERERESYVFFVIYICVCVCCKVERFVLSIEKEWCRFVQKRIRTSDRHKIYRRERERERESIFNFIHIYIYIRK
jgi:hypothetical protein